MHLSSIILTVLSVSGISAATPVPQEGAVNANVPASTLSSFSGKKGSDGKLVVEKAPGAQTDQSLQRKQAVAAVVTIAATAALAKITEIAIEIAADTLKNLGEWNEVRETFTQATTLEMWNRNPDYDTYHAAICYNKGYRLQNATGTFGLTSAKLELGLLNTDYDCMYMTAPNQFYTNNEGGYINLAYRYDNRCTFDQSTGDLTCT
ncbi:hypothetical protein K469DRAFT_742555 [Zopfia rhizophila CBS 207.26]|uniref:DUF7888 domain-containing protein n=1 Tax=Zopfia rhizophila CBS 207.26 TaxID=1314779 RepID=A0A6A6DHA6_9PEZI|nr:hypothetical protein K469DRAFT_742555 [Zopfia rhizophila CBS 207.26]